jgi:hypothetical protein
MVAQIHRRNVDIVNFYSTACPRRLLQQSARSGPSSL